MMLLNKIKSSLIFKLTLPIVIIGLVLLLILLALYKQQADTRVIQQFNSITKNVSDSLVIAVETNAEPENLLRVVSALAAQNKILRIAIIEHATDIIVADNQHANVGLKAQHGLGHSDYITYSQLKNFREAKSHLINNNIYYALSTIRLITPQVNRLRKYHIFLSYNETEAINRISNDLIKFSTLFGSGILVMLFAVYLVQRKILLKPLSNISKAINQQNRLIEPVNHKTINNDELGLLAKSYNQLVRTKIQQDKELEDTRRYIDGITNSVPMLLGYVDLNLCYRFVNKNYEKWFQKKADYFIGKKITDILSPDAYIQITPYITQALSGKKVTFEMDVPFENHPARHTKASYLPDFDDQNNVRGIFGCVEDITEAKDHELQLAEYANTLEFERIALEEGRLIAENALKIKSEFLASMSHEIRTPMNGVIGMLTLLMNTPLNTDQIHKASLAKSSAESLLTLINDILDFSKIESGKIDLEEIDFDLKSMLGNLAETFGKQVHDKGIELILDTADIKHSMVIGDPSRIRQVLTNLISNAIKFTHEGEISITAVLYEDFDDSLNLLCDVKDTGIGIHQTKLNKVFESFTQVDASTTRKYGGTGLGLAIAKRLCQQMGGDIHAKSEEGKGSSFKCTIKLQASELPNPIQAPNTVNGTSVYIVDNNKTSRNVLATQFTLLGANAIKIKSGNEALTLLEKKTKQTHNAIAFINIEMPEMSGLELASKIRENPALNQLKLVAMVPIASQQDNEYYDTYGFNAYFYKPITEANLYKVLALISKETRQKSTETSLPLVDKNAELTWPTNTRILLVEDVQINQLIVQGLLSSFNLNCDIAVNGVEALKTLKDTQQNQAYDIIFMDCQMPEMDGYQASQAIREGEAGKTAQITPIIAMTANAMKGDEEKCLAAGMNDYISKPIDEELLKAKLIKWLINKQALTI